MGKNKVALVLVYLGGLIVLVTVLAGILPFFYKQGIVYFGFGWIKGGIVLAGVLIAGFGLYKLFKETCSLG